MKRLISFRKFKISSGLEFLKRFIVCPGQSEPGSHGNEGVLRIHQSSSITEA